MYVCMYVATPEAPLKDKQNLIHTYRRKILQTLYFSETLAVPNELF
jgi:hypothetical protein